MNTTKIRSQNIFWVFTMVMTVVLIFGFSFTANAQLNQNQINSILSLLESFGADQAVVNNVEAILTGAPVTPAPAMPLFTRDMGLGSTGIEVIRLQQWLNANTYTVATVGAGSPGNETQYFGPRTRQAVANYQIAYGITPPAGYFGPITRGHVNARIQASVPTPPTPPTPPTDPEDPANDEPTNDEPLPAVEGRVDVSRTSSPGNKIGNLRRGDVNEPVFGFSVEARDSQMDVRRVDVVFETTLTERQLARLLDNAALSVAGDIVATRDITRDNLRDLGNNQYEIRLSGFSEKISVGSGRNFVVHVSVTDSTTYVEEYGPATIEVYIPDHGVRAIDQAGLNQTGGSTASRTFSAKAVDADVTIRENNNNPAEGIVIANENAMTNNVRLLSFDVEVDDGEIELFSLKTTITAEIWDTNDYVNFTGENHDQFLANLNLIYDGDGIASEDAKTDNGTVPYTFSNIDLILEEGVHTFHVEVDLLNWATAWEGLGLRADVDADDIMSEDMEGDAPNYGGVALGERQSVYLAAPAAALSGQSFTVGGDNFEMGDGYLEIDVTALGGDVYIANIQNSNGTGIGTEVGLTNNHDATLTVIMDSPSGATEAGNHGWRIREGQTETFRVDFVAEGNPSAAREFTRFAVESIRWTTVAPTAYGDYERVFVGDVLSNLETVRRSLRSNL